jgi:hypothetical protein
MASDRRLYELEFNKLCEWYKIPLGHFNLMDKEEQDELMQDFWRKIRHLVIKKSTKEIILSLFTKYRCN